MCGLCSLSACILSWSCNHGAYGDCNRYSYDSLIGEQIRVISVYAHVFRLRKLPPQYLGVYFLGPLPSPDTKKFLAPNHIYCLLEPYITIKAHSTHQLMTTSRRIFKVLRMITKLTSISVGNMKYLTLGKLLFGAREFMACTVRAGWTCTGSVYGFVILEVNTHATLPLDSPDVMHARAGLLYIGHLVGCLMWYVASDEYTRVKPGSWADAAGLAHANGVTQYV